MSLINEYKKNTIFKYLQLDDYMFIEKVLFNENLFVTGTNRYLNSNIDYKIIIIDDGSNKTTKEILQKLKTENPKKVLLIKLLRNMELLAARAVYQWSII